MIKQRVVCATVLIWLGVGGLGGCAILTAPRSAAELRADALAAYDAGEYRVAAPRLRAYLEERPDDPHGWYWFGNTQAQLGRLRPAQFAYDRALAIDPGLARARHNLGLVHMQLAWKSLLEARRKLPREDHAAAQTMRYLACLMQTFRGDPRPSLCGDLPIDRENTDD